MKSQEIAQFLGTSADTINMRLSRARAKLKAEMIEMMTTTFEDMRLQPAFTFRVVEAIKQLKIEIAPHKTALPFGISVTGILIGLLLSLSFPHSPLYPIGQWIGSALESKTQVTEVGVIPVDTIEVTEITILASETGNGDFGQKPKPYKPPIKAFGVGTWTQKAEMPTARMALATTAADGIIYAIGGMDGPIRGLSTIEAYDPTTNTWTTKADMPTPRWFPAATVVNGIIYVIGGRGSSHAALPTVEAYNPAINTWATKADMPTGRFLLGLGVVNGIIYTVGGTLGDPTNYAGESTIEAYDPAADKWTTKTDMPTPRSAFGVSVVDGILYVIGGQVRGFGLQLPTVEAYNPVSDTWTTKADMPTARALVSASTVNGRIYAIGGGNNALPPVEVYNPAADTWATGIPLSTPRTYHGRRAVNGTIYAIGGAFTWPVNPANPAFASVEAFTPEKALTIVSPQDKFATTWSEIKSKN